MDKKNTNLLFFILMLLFLLGYFWLGNYLWPPKKPEPSPEQAQAGKTEGPPEKPAPPEDKGPPPVAEEPVEPEMTKPVVLGANGGHLTVTLTPRGAGVREVILNHFQQADEYGRPVWHEQDGQRVKKPLSLVPADQNEEIASFLLHHYRRPTDEDFPLDTLGKRVWKRVLPEKVVEGELYRKAEFETTVQGVKITKTYTLEPRWYHVGLQVKLEVVDPQVREKEFRYQLTGAHGLPIEGQWYTSTFRQALIGRVGPKGDLDRSYQDLRQISLKGGGDEVARGDGALRYAGVAVQYFASVIAVDTRDQENKDFLAAARPLLMQGATRGTIANKPLEGDPAEVVLFEKETGKTHTFRFPRPSDREPYRDLLTPGRDVIVTSRTEIRLVKKGGREEEVAEQIITGVRDSETTSPLFHDDITVAVSTPKEKGKVLTLKAGAPVVHKYILYNGPVKVRLLGHLELDQPVDGMPAGAPAVDEGLVRFYRDDLHLNTLTDYRSDNWLSNALSWTPWTSIVIFFTNVIHWVLWALSKIPFLPYGVTILLLTVMVRGAMFPLSRKQALTSLRMQELAPELKKLQEKHKGDRQALGMAQMELYRKHGVSPFGSCWLILLQMPIFLGLYYALQESIHFRLAPFLWMKNLAAPDMLIYWGESIPWISRPSDWGGFLYLGPYFNLLPVIAVALMLVQQKLTMPPPVDEQAAMQMKTIRIMMIVMGLMFYKVAAGLCIYFIASSLWGFAERKLLPKKKDGAPAPAAESKPGLVEKLFRRLQEAAQGGQAAPAATNGASSAAVTAAAAPAAVTAPPPRGKKKRQRDRKKGDAPAVGVPAPEAADGLLARLRSWWADKRARVREWWAEILRQAEKK